MKEEYDPWIMFRCTDMGDNLEEVVETEECKVLRMNGSSGEGLMTIYRVFDGVYLMYNDFHMTYCYSRFNSSSNIFCIDHCREGRIEHRTDNHMHYYMAQGDLRVDRRVHHNGDIYFPVSHYHGITIGFFLDHAERSVRDAMPGVSVDLAALADKYCGKDGIYVLRKHSSIEHIFSELYNVPAKRQKSAWIISRSRSWNCWYFCGHWNCPNTRTNVHISIPAKLKRSSQCTNS